MTCLCLFSIFFAHKKTIVHLLSLLPWADNIGPIVVLGVRESLIAFRWKLVSLPIHRIVYETLVLGKCFTSVHSFFLPLYEGICSQVTWISHFTANFSTFFHCCLSLFFRLSLSSPHHPTRVYRFGSLCAQVSNQIHTHTRHGSCGISSILKSSWDLFLISFFSCEDH